MVTRRRDIRPPLPLFEGAERNAEPRADYHENPEATTNDRVVNGPSLGDVLSCADVRQSALYLTTIPVTDISATGIWRL
jgi:hypothetical protein